MHQDDYEIQDDIQDPLAYPASSNPATMYFDKSMRQPDRKEFLNASIRDVNIQCKLKHWKLLLHAKLPKGQPILDYVWEMNIKRDITTRQVYLWKAILNVHIGQKEYGVNYIETYSPISTWFSIRPLLNLATINKWNSRQVYFIQVYKQATTECYFLMDRPKGFNKK